MSGLPDVPAARVIEAIESLLFRAEEECSWGSVRVARRLLGTLLPEEPDPITTMTLEPLRGSPSVAAALKEALAQVPPEDPVALLKHIAEPPGPPKSPRRSPKPQGQSTGTQRGAIVQSLLAALECSRDPMSVKDVAAETGIDQKRTGIALARLCSEGRIRRTAPGVYTSE